MSQILGRYIMLVTKGLSYYHESGSDLSAGFTTHISVPVIMCFGRLSCSLFLLLCWFLSSWWHNTLYIIIVTLPASSLQKKPTAFTYTLFMSKEILMCVGGNVVCGLVWFYSLKYSYVISGLRMKKQFRIDFFTSWFILFVQY